MPHHQTLSAEGTITHVFGHRFVIDTAKGAMLADITPKGLESIKLHIGNKVSLSGEMKPTELKVSSFRHGGKTVEIAHKDKHDDKHHDDADPKLALRAAKAAGYEAMSEPRRKPKHFEVLGRKNGEVSELHIELDGHIRKTKPADRNDPKWAAVQSA